MKTPFEGRFFVFIFFKFALAYPNLLGI